MLPGPRSGVEPKHVPYRGTVPGITDLVGGQIASTMNPSGDTLSHAMPGPASCGFQKNMLFSRIQYA